MPASYIDTKRMAKMHKQDDPNQSFGLVLHDVARLLRWNFDRRAQTIGLSRAKWSVLAHLRRKNGARQSELAALLEVQPITLGRLLDRMEKDGWVERRDDPADRRAKCIFLTDKVAPVLDQMQALARETRAEAQQGLSEEERAQFLATLLRIRANLAQKSQGECPCKTGDSHES